MAKNQRNNLKDNSQENHINFSEEENQENNIMEKYE